MKSAPRAKLRTKTGCLTCRKRRKKCDECLPVCKSCQISRRQCQWPTSSDLLDRRFLAHGRSRHRANSTETDVPSVDDESLAATNGQTLALRFEENFSNSWASVAIISEAGIVHKATGHYLEPIVFRHFVDSSYDLLLLPSCHHGFHDGWLIEMQDLMVSCKSLYYSLLACAASHIHYINASSQMQELALVYYSNSVSELSKLLADTPPLESHNGLLMTVMFLYLHGLIGGVTNIDIPRHVAAASRILALRLFHRPLAINQLFDHLAVESVLYQIFLITTGLWSDPTGIEYKFDPDFWSQAERLLDQSNFFPNQSRSLSSPVLGVPVSLFRLTLSLRRLYRCQPPCRKQVLDQMRSEVQWWEAALLQKRPSNTSLASSQLNDNEQHYEDAACLYAIIASVLADQLSENIDLVGPAPIPVKGCWKVERGLGILRDHKYDDGWSRSFIGNWPVYTLGFFLSSAEDKELVRTDLQLRWDLTRFAQANRFSHDLEQTWASTART